MEDKSLTDLADEYAQCILTVEAQIEKCRESIEEARAQRRNVRVSRLMRNLSVLYAQRLELTETERHLRSYYSKEERKAG